VDSRVQVADESRGYPRDERVWSDVLGDDRARGHHRSSADSNARKDHRARADPRAVADLDWAVDESSAPLCGRAYSVIYRDQRHVVTHIHMVPDPHGRHEVDVQGPVR
jgi:hypothetical protein